LIVQEFPALGLSDGLHLSSEKNVWRRA